MTPARTGAYTDVFREQYGTSFTEGLTAAAVAATAGDWKQATILADRFQAGGRHLSHSVVRDALAAGLDWWRLGELLTMHPQAAFDQYANLLVGTTTPAQQRPHLAVVCTAGLVAEHDMAAEYGIDLDDLDPQHSLTTDRTVVRLREAAELLGEDVWIAVKLPGEGEGDDDLPDFAAIRRWTTVALYPDELGWLREALALNAGAENPDDQDNELEPL
jgi:hypothetical protein